MTLYSTITIAGVSYNNATSFLQSIRVNTSLGQENFASASFEARFDNTAGTYDDTFSINQDVRITLDTTSPSTTRIFRGTVESIEPESMPNREYIILRGRDYSSRLMDVTALETYNNTEVSAIITDLMDKYINTPTSQVTVTNVQTTTTILTSKTFRRKPIFECIKELAHIVDYDFFVDDTNDLHFQPRSSVSTGVTLNNGNVKNAKFITNDQDLFNRIWVYGGRYLSGFREDFIANGGSSFTLLSKPHNTQILVAGSIQKGGIFQMTTAEQSGTDYLVDYENRLIIFTSGTTWGANIPASGGSVIINYDRTLPIVKRADDSSSQTLYGTREKIIINNEITEPSAATQIARAELARYKEPRQMGTVRVNSSSIARLTVGNTIIINLPNEGIVSEEFQIIGVEYDITTRNLLADEVVLVRVSQKVIDMIDILKNQILALRQLQAQEIDTTDVYTQLLQYERSGLAFVKSWYVYSRTINNSFILGQSKLGSYFDVDNAEWSGGAFTNNIMVTGGTVKLIL